MAIGVGGAGVLDISIVAGGAGTYTAVNLLQSADFKHTLKPADTTVLGDTYTDGKGTLDDVTYTGKGFFDYYGDTTGQKLIWDYMMSHAEIWAKMVYDGTHYVKSRIVVSGFSISAKPSGMVETDITLESTGAPAWG
jgi:hypothetical protein